MKGIKIFCVLGLLLFVNQTFALPNRNLPSQPDNAESFEEANREWICEGYHLPKEQRVPGGVAIVPLNVDLNAPQPEVSYKSKKVAVFKHCEHLSPQWIAVFGIPLSHQGSELLLDVEDQGKKSTRKIQVTNKQYPTETLTIKKSPEKQAPQAIVERLAQEKKRIDEALALWQPKRIDSFELIEPVKGRLSGEFGARRVINGEEKSPHRGIDIAAVRGTPIVAAASGTVVNTGEYLLTGKTVIVDHGQNFKTLYCHLDSISVKQGDHLKSGQKLGTLGKTGRATGPHLHFGVSLNDERVCPELFFS